MAETHAPGALDGVKVLEIAQALAVPFAGELLADMGADVVKIEPPAGDGIRHTMEPIVPGESKGYTLVNRGKRAICLDITSAAARPALERLVAWADVVMISLKPADLPRYRLRYEDLRPVNPRVIFLEHWPLGQRGPFGGEPGYDVIVQAISGTSVVTAREKDGVPMNIRPAFNDMGTGAFSALGVVAALRHRDLTGEGQRIETSLLGTAMAMGNQLLSWFAATDPAIEERFQPELDAARARGAEFAEQRAIWERHYVRGGHGNIYFRHYRTSDGFVSVGCLSPQLNARFRAVTGIKDPRQDPGFDLSTDEGYDRMTALVRECEDIFRQHTTAEWIATLQAGGVPCGPFNFPPDALHDPQLTENGYVIELEHPLLGAYRTHGTPIHMDGTPTRVKGPPPLLDQHTDEVLAQVGFSDAEIAVLRESHAVGAHRR